MISDAAAIVSSTHSSSYLEAHDDPARLQKGPSNTDKCRTRPNMRILSSVFLFELEVFPKTETSRRKQSSLPTLDALRRHHRR
jgi:hypothetical protein